MIEKILEVNPLDSLNKDGSPFWSAEKRPPTVLKFSMKDPIHKSFAVFCSKLIGDVFNIKFKFN